jgi:xanthine dehydrogenase accessory factor
VRLLVERLDPAASAWLQQARPGDALLTRFLEGRIERAVAPGATPSPCPARGVLEAGAAIIEAVGAPPQPLLLFGAGHIGQALAAAVRGLPFDLNWFDTRPELASSAGLRVEGEAALAARAAEAPAGAAILIMTHDHALDFRLTAAALQGDAGFVGLIGSATKRARFLSRLDKAGLGEAARARLTCPIGLPGIAGKAPPVIAIAVLAQLLLRQGADG